MGAVLILLKTSIRAAASSDISPPGKTSTPGWHFKKSWADYEAILNKISSEGNRKGQA